MLTLNSDLHVHTDLSPCASRAATVRAQLEAAKACGIETLGFSNHYWDSEIPGANSWYQPLDTDHLMKIRGEIAALEDDFGIRILVGAEIEASGFLALSPENADKFDYILISASHTHIEELMVGYRGETAEDVRLILVERFLKTVAEAADLGIPATVCHPFHPLGYPIETEAEALDGITDRMLAEILSFAAKRNIGIEAHWQTMHDGGSEGKIAPYSERFLRMAREVGCRFTLGSDSHDPTNLAARNREMRDLARQAGITDELMMDL